MSNPVRVIDNLSGSILFETSIDKMDEAYTFAAMMEKEGLDIKITSLGLTETLIKSLGASESEISKYQTELHEEIANHEDDFGCMACLPRT